MGTPVGVQSAAVTTCAAGAPVEARTDAGTAAASIVAADRAIRQVSEPLRL